MLRPCVEVRKAAHVAVVDVGRVTVLTIHALAVEAVFANRIALA
jgi:hypothetical protein